ncbi:hypothetical protein [Azospirillum oryzae]|uniref:hypothetical protein n=1 Tax=Azospirillum oryzae TaxID=286727 RepID=UPI001FE4871C|nr:hypothetical protein [Azospirillum oryzae]
MFGFTAGLKAWGARPFGASALRATTVAGVNAAAEMMASKASVGRRESLERTVVLLL